VPSVPRSRWSCSEALGEGVSAGERSVRARDLPSPRATELLPEHVRVGLRGSRRDAEPSCDLVVRVSGGDQLDHLKLPIRDCRRPLMQDCDHAATLPTHFARAYWPDGVSCDLRLRAYWLRQLRSARVPRRPRRAGARPEPWCARRRSSSGRSAASRSACRVHLDLRTSSTPARPAPALIDSRQSATSACRSTRLGWSAGCSPPVCATKSGSPPAGAASFGNHTGDRLCFPAAALLGPSRTLLSGARH